MRPFYIRFLYKQKPLCYIENRENGKHRSVIMKSIDGSAIYRKGTEKYSMETGIKGFAEETVDRKNVASAVGSGLLDVYSTPSMIALIEKTAKDSVEPYLESGQGTVGMHLEVDHLAPTPIGETVRAESELIEAEGRVLTFSVSVYSRVEKIGQAIHKRCIIFNDRFEAKMKTKYEEK